MATIYDVAARAGVSIATVSKVLSGNGSISEKTRVRVLDAVAALDYVPNAAARSLARERTGMIGVALAYDPDDLFADPNLLQILHAVDTVITAHDGALLLSTARSADDPLSGCRRLLKGYQLDGLLLEGNFGTAGEALVRQARYPCVVIGYSTRGLPCVYPDDYHGALMLMRHLIDLGHRAIGIINGPTALHQPAMEARLAGCRDALAEAGLALRPELIVPGTFRSESGYRGAAQLMVRTPTPTAIFAFNDRMALGALRWLREHGYRVPEDVSVAGFDDIASASEASPPITTVRLSPREIARRAAEMLFAFIEGTPPGEARVVLPTQLIVRGSTGAARRDAAA